MTTSQYDAIVLAGGRSRRMGVADKTRLAVGGVPLLDRTLQSLTGAARVIVVGDARPTAGDVIWTREQPDGGGPAAAVAAGLLHVTADVVVLLAADLPLVTPADVDVLVAAIDGAGALYLDDARREQWLCSAWRTESLRTASLDAGSSMRDAFAGLTFARVRAPTSVLDCDTPEDLARAEELLR